MHGSYLWAKFAKFLCSKNFLGITLDEHDMWYTVFDKIYCGVYKHHVLHTFDVLNGDTCKFLTILWRAILRMLVRHPLMKPPGNTTVKVTPYMRNVLSPAYARSMTGTRWLQNSGRSGRGRGAL